MILICYYGRSIKKEVFNNFYMLIIFSWFSWNHKEKDALQYVYLYVYYYS